VTGRLCAAGRQFQDWTADYRLLARERVDRDEMFTVARREVGGQLKEKEPLVAAMDDTLLRKRGKKISGVSYKRDPLSPPFRFNLVTGLRVLQISAALPLAPRPAPALSIPIDLVHAPAAPKPKKKAPPEEWTRYRQLQKEMNLSRRGAERIARLREQLDHDPGGPERELLMAVDGSYTNQTVLRNLPPRTALVGRVRKDANFFYPPHNQTAGPGRKKSYGQPAPTPEQLRQDESVPWQTVPVFAAGKRHDFKVKTIGPLLWKTAGPDRPLLLVVIAPLGYRPRKGSKLLYRQPAYLIATSPQLELPLLLQAYVWRWGIEVNFRDQKQIVGVGQAQLRNQNSVQLDPALATAAYAFLILAAKNAFPKLELAPTLPPPKWRKSRPSSKPSTQDWINLLRLELWGEALARSDREDITTLRRQGGMDHERSSGENFSGFVNAAPNITKPLKSLPRLTSALLYVCN